MIYVVTCTCLSADPDFNGECTAQAFKSEASALAYFREIVNNEIEEETAMGKEPFVEYNVDYETCVTWDGGNEGFKAEVQVMDLKD